MDKNECIDVLDPLTTINWGPVYSDKQGFEDLSKISLHMVSLDERVYVSASNTIDNSNHLISIPISALQSSTAAFEESVTRLSLPYEKFRHFTLTTYHSRLVLVGGLAGESVFNPEAKTMVVSDLWTSADGTRWEKSLPPMPTSRSAVAVVNPGTPDCLVVIGGYCSGRYPVTAVEVLLEGEWFSLQSLPCPVRGYVRATLHNGNLYLTSDYAQDMYYCRLESLLTTRDRTKIAGLWKKMNSPSFILKSIGQHLVAFGCHGVINLRPFDNMFRLGGLNHLQKLLHAYCPSTQSWVCVGTAPQECCPVYDIVTVNGEMIVAGFQKDIKVTTMKFEVSPYDIDNEFSKTALCKLEAAGILVASSLQNVHVTLARAIGVAVEENCCEKFEKHKQKSLNGEAASCHEKLMDQWISRSASRPPTWRTLYEVLAELDLEELSQQIKEHFTCPRPLKVLSVSMILFALLQQRSLEPDQIHVRLPQYVPTSIKDSITHSFSNHIYHK